MGLELTEEDVSEWLEADHDDLGYEHLDDDGIAGYVLTQSDTPDDSMEETNAPTLPVVSHMDGMEMLDECLTAQPEATLEFCYHWKNYQPTNLWIFKVIRKYFTHCIQCFIL